MELFRECIKYNGMKAYRVKKMFRMSVRKFTEVANTLPREIANLIILEK